MSLAAMTWAIAQDVIKSQKLVLTVLADMADSEHSCWPSQRKLSELTGFSPRTISTAITALETAGLIRRERRYWEFGKRRSDRYFLAVTDCRKSYRKTNKATKISDSKHLTTPQEQPVVVSESATVSAGVDGLGVLEVAELDVELSKLNPGLTVAGLATKLKTVKVHELDLLAACRVALGRATRTVFSPCGFVAKIIDSNPEPYKKINQHDPGQIAKAAETVAEKKRLRNQIREALQARARENKRHQLARQKANCAHGIHSWAHHSPETLQEEYRLNGCDYCGIKRRGVDPAWRAKFPKEEEMYQTEIAAQQKWLQRRKECENGRHLWRRQNNKTIGRRNIATGYRCEVVGCSATTESLNEPLTTPGGS